VVPFISARRLDGEEEVGAVRPAAGAGARFLAAGAIDHAEGGGEELPQIQESVEETGALAIEIPEALTERADITGPGGHTLHSPLLLLL
jgi:hypothetical protein